MEICPACSDAAASDARRFVFIASINSARFRCASCKTWLRFVPPSAEKGLLSTWLDRFNSNFVLFVFFPVGVLASLAMMLAAAATLSRGVFVGVVATLLGLCTAFAALRGIRRWRNAELRAAEHQSSHPSLDPLRDLRSAFRSRGFRIAVVKVALSALLTFALLGAFVHAVRAFQSAV